MRRITLTYRNLPLPFKRVSLFVASSGGEYIFDGTECRKIKELKFASQATFDIEHEGVEILAVLDAESNNPKVSRFLIPDGSFSLYYKLCVDMKGTISFVEVNKTIRTIGRFQRELIVFLALILCIGIYFGGMELYFGIRSISKTPANFIKGDVEIILTDAFVELDSSSEGFYAVYVTNSCNVTITREGFDETPAFEDMTVTDFLSAFVNLYFFPYQQIVSEDGLDYVVFEAEFEKTYRYHLYVFKTDDEFWVLEISCPKYMYNYWSSSFNDWAKSFNFK